MNVIEKKPCKLLRLNAVLEAAGIGRTQLMEHVMRGEFPKPVKVTKSGRSIAWLMDEVVAWQETRIAERDRSAAREYGRD
jgi:predicted DNA-binding transcriptional regulator AlpA